MLSRSPSKRVPFARWVPLAIAALFGIGACAGTEVGNPAAPAETTIEFGITLYETPGALRLGSGVELDEVWLFIDNVDLRASADCDEESPDELERPGPIAVELVSGLELPGPIELSKEPGGFCRLELSLREAEAAELPLRAPAELADSSVMVRGRTADGRPFELRSALHEEWRLEAKEVDFLLDAGRHRLIVAFAVEAWFLTVDLNTADGDTTILIDQEHNDELLAGFEQALKRSVRLMRDANRDGVIDNDEAAEPIASEEQP